LNIFLKKEKDEKSRFIPVENLTSHKKKNIAEDSAALIIRKTTS